MPKKKAGSFNLIQIKDGWIVKMYKDGRVRSKIEEYKPNHKKVEKDNG